MSYTPGRYIVIAEKPDGQHDPDGMIQVVVEARIKMCVAGHEPVVVVVVVDADEVGVARELIVAALS